MGKSTLFNRLIGQNRSITHALPGVTRDAVSQPVLWDREKPFLLLDTGGWLPEEKETEDGDRFRKEMAESVSSRSERTFQDSRLILWVVAREEKTAADEELFRKLLPYRDKIVLVVNKVDHPEQESEIWDFSGWGFRTVLGVSASHKRNIPALKETVLRTLSALPGIFFPSPAPTPETAAAPANSFPPDSAKGFVEDTAKDAANDAVQDSPESAPEIRIALCGKPNAGKSTLLNRLTRRELSLVSSVPGTTRDVVQGYARFGSHGFQIFDTAGMRRRTKVKENIEYYSVSRALRCLEDCDLVFLLIDGEEGFTDQDKKISRLVTSAGKGLILLLNKWDRLASGSETFEKVRERIRFLCPVIDYAPVLPISAEKDRDFSSLFKTALRIDRRLRHKVGTGELNRLLRHWTEFSPLAQQGHSSYKIRYATQISSSPVKFVLFVNKTAGFPENYRRYLINQIRRQLGFKEIPFELILREG